MQEHLGIRQAIHFFQDVGVVEPSRQAFDAAFGLGPIGYLGGNTGPLAALAAHDATDESCQSGQMLGQTTAGLVRLTLNQSITYGTIAPKVVTHRMHLLVKSVLNGVYTMRQPLLNVYTKMTCKYVRW